MNSMSKSTLFLVVILVGIHSAAAQAPTKPNYYAEICGRNLGNYTTNSTYEANVVSVLSDLYSQSSVASFSNASAGSAASGDQVFGQYYCRGDISASLCSDCIKEAATTVFVNCHNFKFAVVWFRECTLRYQNVSMVGLEDELPNVIGWSDANATDPLAFAALVNKTMTGLIQESAFGGNSLFFAVGEAAVSQLETVYCLVQCSPDLDSAECDTCLHAASGLIPDWSPKLVSVFLPSCQLRYSTVAAFYSLPNAPPPPPSVTVPSPASPSPPPIISSTPRPSSSTMLRSGKSLNTRLLISALVFTLLRFR